MVLIGSQHQVIVCRLWSVACGPTQVIDRLSTVLCCLLTCLMVLTGRFMPTQVRSRLIVCQVWERPPGVLACLLAPASILVSRLNLGLIPHLPHTMVSCLSPRERPAVNTRHTPRHSKESTPHIRSASSTQKRPFVVCVLSSSRVCSSSHVSFASGCCIASRLP